MIELAHAIAASGARIIAAVANSRLAMSASGPFPSVDNHPAAPAKSLEDGDATSVDARSPADTQAVLPLDLEVRAAEKKALERALVVAKHNRSLAARLLGVSRSTLYAKLEEHGLL